MITSIIVKLIQLFDTLYNDLQISSLLSDLISRLTTFRTYLPDFKYYLSGIYFIFGKSLVTYVVGVAVSLFSLRLAIALWKIFKK